MTAALHSLIQSNGDMRAQKLREVDVANAASDLLTALGVDLTDENFADTPRRFATYMLEHFLSAKQFEAVVDECRAKTFPSSYDGMVVEQKITAWGMCPHHLLPVSYRVDVAYLPSRRAIGLSKLARIADVCARMPLLQEEATILIANTLRSVLQASDVAVVMRGQHLCMRARGVKVHDGGEVTTSSLTGQFKYDPSTRAEFLALTR